MIQTLLPDLTRIRPLMRELLAYHASNDKKSVVLLAVDGVRYADAEKLAFSTSSAADSLCFSDYFLQLLA